MRKQKSVQLSKAESLRCLQCLLTMCLLLSLLRSTHQKEHILELKNSLTAMMPGDGFKPLSSNPPPSTGNPTLAFLSTGGWFRLPKKDEFDDACRVSIPVNMASDAIKIDYGPKLTYSNGQSSDRWDYLYQRQVGSDKLLSPCNKWVFVAFTIAYDVPADPTEGLRFDDKKELLAFFAPYSSSLMGSSDETIELSIKHSTYYYWPLKKDLQIKDLFLLTIKSEFPKDKGSVESADLINSLLEIKTGFKEPQPVFELFLNKYFVLPSDRQIYKNNVLLSSEDIVDKMRAHKGYLLAQNQMITFKNAVNMQQSRINQCMSVKLRIDLLEGTTLFTSAKLGLYLFRETQTSFSPSDSLFSQVFDITNDGSDYQLKTMFQHPTTSGTHLEAVLPISKNSMFSIVLRLCEIEGHSGSKNLVLKLQLANQQQLWRPFNTAYSLLSSPTSPLSWPLKHFHLGLKAEMSPDTSESIFHVREFEVNRGGVPRFETVYGLGSTSDFYEALSLPVGGKQVFICRYGLLYNRENNQCKTEAGSWLSGCSLAQPPNSCLQCSDGPQNYLVKGDSCQSGSAICPRKNSFNHCIQDQKVCPFNQKLSLTSGNCECIVEGCQDCSGTSMCSACKTGTVLLMTLSNNQQELKCVDINTLKIGLDPQFERRVYRQCLNPNCLNCSSNYLLCQQCSTQDKTKCLNSTEKPCHLSCKKCSNTVSNICEGCLEGQFLYPNNTCGLCSEEDFEISGSKCVKKPKCYSACLTCKDETQYGCLTCPEERHLMPKEGFSSLSPGRCALDVALSITKRVFVKDIGEAQITFNDQVESLTGGNIESDSEILIVENSPQEIKKWSLSADPTSSLSINKTLKKVPFCDAKSPSLKGSLFKVKISCGQTLRQATLLVRLKKPNSIVKMSNPRVSFDDRFIWVSNINMVVTSFDKAMEKLQGPAKGVLGGVTMSFFLLSIPQAFILMKLFQTVDFYIFIDSNNPSNFTKFLKMISNNMMDYVPNLFKNLVQNDRAPVYSRFEEFGMKAHFFFNMGQIMTIFLIMGALKLFFLAIYKAAAASPISALKIPTQKLYKFLGVGIFYGALEAFHIDLVLSLILHIAHFKNLWDTQEAGEKVWNFIATLFIGGLIIGLACLYLFMFYNNYMIRKLLKLKKNPQKSSLEKDSNDISELDKTKIMDESSALGLEESTDKKPAKCSFSLTTDIWSKDKRFTLTSVANPANLCDPRSFFQTHTNLLLLLRDLLNGLLLYFLYTQPLALISTLLFFQLILVFYCLKRPPYLNRGDTIILVITHVCQVLLQILFGVNILVDNNCRQDCAEKDFSEKSESMSEERRYYFLGFSMISVVIVLILSNVVIGFYFGLKESCAKRRKKKLGVVEPKIEEEKTVNFESSEKSNFDFSQDPLNLENSPNTENTGAKSVSHQLTKKKETTKVAISPAINLNQLTMKPHNPTILPRNRPKKRKLGDEELNNEPKNSPLGPKIRSPKRIKKMDKKETSEVKSSLDLQEDQASSVPMRKTLRPKVVSLSIPKPNTDPFAEASHPQEGPFQWKTFKKSPTLIRSENERKSPRKGKFKKSRRSPSPRPKSTNQFVDPTTRPKSLNPLSHKNQAKKAKNSNHKSHRNVDKRETEEKGLKKNPVLQEWPAQSSNQQRGRILSFGDFI